MSVLEISGLHAEVAGTEILRGVDLRLESGEVHAVMGPNGAGKSTLSAVIMGRPGYTVTAGSVTLDGTDILSLSTWERAAAGVHLIMQYPTEVPGVSLVDALSEALQHRGRDTSGLFDLMKAEADRIGFEHRFLDRPLNVDFSGGEKKRNETLQLAVLRPRFAILDELDSGLDIDALKIVANGVNSYKNQKNSFLIITHYQRLLDFIKPDFIHVLSNGKIIKTGSKELGEELEKTGYTNLN